MNKFETLLQLKCRERVLKLEQVFRSVLWNEKMQRTTRAGKGGAWSTNELAEPSWMIAERLVKLLKTEPVMTKEYEKTMAKLGVKKSRYYTVVNKMRDAGMLYVQDGRYLPSNEFAMRLDEMAAMWREQVNEIKATERMVIQTK